MGVRFTDKPPLTVADSLYGIRNSSGVISEGPISVDNLSKQMAASGAIAERLTELDTEVNNVQVGYNFVQAPIRVRATGNVAIATALENGDTLNGETLATGDYVFLPGQSAGATISYTLPDGSTVTNSPGNGIYTVAASGAATRATFADSAAELARIGLTIQGGTAGAGEKWVLPLAKADITVGTTPLPFSLYGIENDFSAEIVAARGGEASLGDRLDGIDDSVADAENAAGVIAPDLEEDWVEAWFDVNGHVVVAIERDGGRLEAQSGSLVDVSYGSNAGGVTLISPDLDEDWIEVWADEAGDVFMAVTRDGSRYEAQAGTLVKISSGAGAGTGETGVYAFDYASHLQILDDDDAYHFVIVKGQSLSQGVNGLVGDTALTTIALHAGYALMFDAGTRPQDATVSDFVDLREEDFLDGKETICSGMADVIMTGLNAALGKKPKIVFAISGRGGATYQGNENSTDGLKRGSQRYAEAIRLINRASEIADSKGSYLASVTLVSALGETNQGIGTTEWEYMRYLSQWRMDLEAECRKIGIMEPVRAYTYQTCRGSQTAGVPVQVANAQLKIQDMDPGWRCIGPNYFAEDATGGGTPGDVGVDTAHPSSYGYFVLGMAFGNAILRDLFGAADTPMRVLDSWWESSTVFALKYPYPVTIESTDDRITISTLGAGKGIDFDDGSGSPPTISSIAVSGGDNTVVKVTLSGAPSGLRRRAFVASRKTVSQQGQGPVHGIRSGIRSTASYGTDPYESEAQYRWACTETIQL